MSDDYDPENATKEFLTAIFGDRPNPYSALDRITAMPQRAQRKILRLVVHCEREGCRSTPVRVFTLREGLLVQCRSDASTKGIREHHPHLTDWNRRRAFFLDEWLSQPADVLPNSHLQVVCDCDQTHPRLVNVRRLADAVPADGERTRHIRLTEVSA